MRLFKFNFFVPKLRLINTWNLCLFLTCFTLIDFSLCRHNLTALERLIHKVFTVDKYNELIRPVDSHGFTNVNTELKLLQIDLDEKYQEFISTVWLEMTWVDSRLNWKPAEFEDITEITLPVNKLWTPDIVLQNGVGQNDYLTEFKYFNPWISHTGAITWVPEIRLHTKCLIKVKDFPFDTQCCEVNFYSWAHTARQMTIQQFGNKNVTNTTHLSTNTEWEVYNTCALNKTIMTGANLEWWVTSYVVNIKRNSIYHIYGLVLPCLLLSSISVLLFLLPPDSGEKIALGVTILLGFFVNSLVVSNYTPEGATDVPVIGLYYILNIFLLAIWLGATVGVLNFHFRGHKVSSVPRWVKRVLFIKSKTIESNTLTHNNTNLRLNELKLNNYLNNFNHMNSTNMTKNNMISNSSISTTSNNLLAPKQLNKLNENRNPTNLDKILKIMKVYIHKLDKNSLKSKYAENVSIEWKEVARRIDMILCLLVTITVTALPIYLFGKFIRNDHITSTFNSNRGCGCY